VSKSRKFLEVTHEGGLEGIIAVEVDGFATVHQEWLKRLILESGRTYEEVGDR